MFSRRCGLLMLSVAGLATACGNPAIDPNARYEVEGQALGADGEPLEDVEVRLLKYWSDSRLLEPTTEQIFADTPRGDDGVGFNIELVDTVRTDDDGDFEFEIYGEQIALPGGYSTADGLVEGAKVIVVVRDPNDPDRRSGVYSYPKTFMRSDAKWGAGDLEMWDAAASADFTRANSTGLLRLSWRGIERGSSTVRNKYRITVEGASGGTGRLLIRCNEGDVVEGGCAKDPNDSTMIERYLSAYSVRAYYADTNGEVLAYVQANGPNHRFVSRFAITDPVPDIRDTRDPVGLDGLWAVGTGADQRLLDSFADDEDPRTREKITNSATAIYAKLRPADITDAGLLNALVTNAANACLILEFSVTNFSDLAAAKDAGGAMWVQKGKACGENGARNEMSSLVSFDTTGSDSVVAAWMRIRAVADGGVAAPTIAEVGEVAVFTPKR